MSEPKRNQDDQLGPRHSFGALCVFLAFGIFVLAILDQMYGLPIDLARTWYVHKPLWLCIAMLLLGAGWLLQRKLPEAAWEWQPSTPGVRFTRLIVYSRPECHLCDDAKGLLLSYAPFLPKPEEIDISGNPELEARFGTEIPVVEIDGTIRFRGPIDELLLQRLIEGTPPHGKDE